MMGRILELMCRFALLPFNLILYFVLFVFDCSMELFDMVIGGKSRKQDMSRFEVRLAERRMRLVDQRKLSVGFRKSSTNRRNSAGYSNGEVSKHLADVNRKTASDEVKSL